MAACFCLYLFGTRVLAKEDTITSLFYTAATVFVPLTVLMPFVWKGLTLKPLIVMALIGLAGFGLLFALDRTLETTWIGRVAPILTSEPFWYSLINSLLFRNPFHLRDIAAGLIILAVGGWSYFSTINRDYQPSPDATLAQKSISND
jgi:drug/metabolite transporter (DMT)-like permease